MRYSSSSYICLKELIRCCICIMCLGLFAYSLYLDFFCECLYLDLFCAVCSDALSL